MALFDMTKAPSVGSNKVTNLKGASPYPAYTPVYNPASMNLNAKMQQRRPSAWFFQNKALGDLEEQNKLNEAQHSSAAATAAARDALAAQGGLSSGARERTGQQGVENLLNMSQGIRRAGQENDLKLAVEDEENRLKTAQFDVSNQMAEGERKNNHAMDLYKTKMSAWAADRQATATANAGKK